jgi:hypothetical protein
MLQTIHPAALIAASALCLCTPDADAAVTFTPAEPGRWAFEVGVAWITSNTIDDLRKAQVNVADGPEGGEIFLLTASRELGHFGLDGATTGLLPRVEMPLSIEIVNENARDPFPAFHASIVLRWDGFPWDHLVKTTFASGIGLSYWSKIYAMDIRRHPDSDRSHVKFNWPIQLTLASPARPADQLILFVLHQSGGHVFDRGGVNSIGMGYRRGF